MVNPFANGLQLVGNNGDKLYHRETTRGADEKLLINKLWPNQRRRWVNPRHYILATRQGFSVMMTFGKIHEFDSACEDQPQYEEQLGYFFVANSIDNADKKCAVFFNVIGAATFKLLCSLVPPSNPGKRHRRNWLLPWPHTSTRLPHLLFRN